MFCFPGLLYFVHQTLIFKVLVNLKLNLMYSLVAETQSGWSKKNDGPSVTSAL